MTTVPGKVPPSGSPRPLRKVAAEAPTEPEIIQPVIEPAPVPTVPNLPTTMREVMYQGAFDEGWNAALKAVEAQWNHGADGLSRFLAAHKRLAQ